MELYGKVKSVEPGSVWYDFEAASHKFTVRINGRLMSDEEPYLRAVDARKAMNDLITKMKKRHGL